MVGRGGGRRQAFGKGPVEATPKDLCWSAFVSLFFPILLFSIWVILIGYG